MTTATMETERMTLVRTFETHLTEGDGRTLEARIAPYNTPAEVADPPDFRPYLEMFAPGAFERQLRSPSRVRMWLNFEHEPGLRGIVGHGFKLDDSDDGLHGTFRVHPNADGDKALQMVNDGLLTGLSLEFAALRSRTVDGVVQRIRAHIDKVALCRFPAYQGAEVLAIREQPHEDGEDDEGDDDETPPARTTVEGVPLPDGLAERMEALGVPQLRRIATTGKAWDGSPARFTDEQYRRATLFCRGGDAPPKQDCSLPVLEPDGTLNTNALGAAAAALAGARGGVANASQAMKAAAARKLVRYYNAAGVEPPESLLALARS